MGDELPDSMLPASTFIRSKISLGSVYTLTIPDIGLDADPLISFCFPLNLARGSFDKFTNSLNASMLSGLYLCLGLYLLVKRSTRSLGTSFLMIGVGSNPAPLTLRT